MPNNAKNASAADADAALKRGFLKKRTSNAGWSLWASKYTKPASSSAPVMIIPVDQKVDQWLY